MSDDARLDAFLNWNTPDVFGSVLAGDDVWRPDPLDVPIVHAEARRAFERTIDQMIEKRERRETVSLDKRIMVVTGAAGTGKTHLMRAFRNSLHRTGRGFFAYMQMGVNITDYPRYILFNILESLSRPYNPDTSPQSSLEYVARSLMHEAHECGLLDEESEKPEGFDPDYVTEQLTNRVEAFADAEPGVFSALLHMERRIPAVSKIAINYLRCEDLSPRQRQLIGGLPPMTGEHAPSRVIEWLANIIAMTYDRPLVLCVDQLDLFYSNDTDAEEKFRKAVAALEALAENPNIVTIVSALDDYYVRLRDALTAAQLQRLEGGLAPIHLDAGSKPEEVRDVLAHRLKFLYKEAAVPFDGAQPLYPFMPDVSEHLSGPPLRIALQEANAARNRSRRTGTPPTVIRDDVRDTEPTELDIASVDFDKAWNDFRFATHVEAPDGKRPIEELLETAVRLGNRELGKSHRAKAQWRDHSLMLTLEIASQPDECALVSLVNQRPAFGRLAREIRKVVNRCETQGLVPVLVRTDAFPQTRSSQLKAAIDDATDRGARLVTMTDLELRTILSFMAFDLTYGSQTAYDRWLVRSKPITSLPGMIALLRLEGVQIPFEPAERRGEKRRSGTSADRRPPVADAPPVPEIARNGAAHDAESAYDVVAASGPEDHRAFDLGTRTNGDGRFAIDVQDLTRHAAIVGNAGSGKSTLAFSIVETALALGIPAILIDRKGDLATYASDAAWQRRVDPATDERRERLRASIDVALFTPGNSIGRNLAIHPIPSGLEHLAPIERDQEARAAAEGLASLMNWTAAKNNQLAVLGIAISTLVQTRPAKRQSLPALLDFLEAKGPELLSAIGRISPKIIDRVVEDLEALRLGMGSLIDGDAEPIDIERLLGTGIYAGDKTRLTIVSTEFLGQDRAQLFWVSRLISELGRYARRRPSNALQAIVLFDEADAYLPAASKPPTKAALENLFGRAREAGLGIVLATQNPAELDFKQKENITTWLVGRVNQPQALSKLGGIFGARGVASLAKLPQLKVGNFYGISESTGIVAFSADLPALEPEAFGEGAILDLARKTGR